MPQKIIGKVSLVPKGQYNASTKYEHLDVVNYQGNSYVAIQDTNGNIAPTNTAYWALLAEKGSSITLNSHQNEYVLSDSGNTIPASGWSTTIPNLQPEKYLWTRTTLNLTSGNPIISYTVAYQGKNGENGLDGVGSVSTVNNISPDSNNNVTLTPSDLGIEMYEYGEVIGNSAGSGSVTGIEIKCFGYVTEGSTRMFLTLIPPKLFKVKSQLRITSVTGAIRNSYSGYIETLGADFTQYLRNNQTIWDCNTSYVDVTFEKVEGFVRSTATGVVVNNIPVTGYVTLIGEVVEKN